MAVDWTHTRITGDDNGVAWATAGSGAATAYAGGGYATEAGKDDVPVETDGASAVPDFPVVAAFPVRNYETGRQDFRVGFAVPKGTDVDAHVWITTS